MGGDDPTTSSLIDCPTKYYLTDDPRQDKEVIREAICYKLQGFDPRSLMPDTEFQARLMKIKERYNRNNNDSEVTNGSTSSLRLSQRNSISLTDLSSYITKHREKNNTVKSKCKSTSNSSESEKDSSSLSDYRQDHHESLLTDQSNKNNDQAEKKFPILNGVTIIVSDEHCEDFPPDLHNFTPKPSKNELHPDLAARRRRRSLTVAEGLLSVNHKRRKKKTNEDVKKDDNTFYEISKRRLSKILKGRRDSLQGGQQPLLSLSGANELESSNVGSSPCDPVNTSDVKCVPQQSSHQSTIAINNGIESSTQCQPSANSSIVDNGVAEMNNDPLTTSISSSNQNSVENDQNSNYTTHDIIASGNDLDKMNKQEPSTIGAMSDYGYADTPCNDCNCMQNLPSLVIEETTSEVNQTCNSIDKSDRDPTPDCYSTESIPNRLNDSDESCNGQHHEKEDFDKTDNLVTGEIAQLKSRLENIRKNYEKGNDRNYHDINSLQNQLKQPSYLESIKYQEELQAFNRNSDSQRGEISHLKELLQTAHKQLEGICSLQLVKKPINCISPPTSPRERFAKSYQGRRRGIIRKPSKCGNQCFTIDVPTAIQQNRPTRLTDSFTDSIGSLPPLTSTNKVLLPIGERIEKEKNKLEELKSRIIDAVNRSQPIGNVKNKLIGYVKSVDKSIMTHEDLIQKLKRDLEKCLSEDDLNFLASTLSEAIITIQESNDDNKKLKADLEDTQQDLSGNVELVATLKTQLNEALSSGSNNLDTIRNLEYEKAEVKTQLDVKIKELEVLVKELDDAQKEIDAYKGKSELVKGNEKLHLYLALIWLRRLEHELNASKDMIEALQTKLSSQDEKLEAETESIGKELKELRSKIIVEQTQNSELKAKLDRSLEKTSEDEKDIRELQRIIDELQDNLQATTDRCRFITGERDRLDEDLGRSNADISTLRVDLEREQNNSAMLQGIVDSLKRDKNDAESEKSTSDEELNLVQKALQQEKEMSKDLSKEIESLKMELQERNREVNNLKDNEASLQRDLGILKKSFENEQKNAADNLAELTILRAELETHEEQDKVNSCTKDQLNSEVNALQSDVDHWKNLSEKTANEKGKLQIELNKVQRELSDFEEECKKMREDIVKLEEKIKLDKETISSLESESKLLQAKLQISEGAAENSTEQNIDSNSEVKQLFEDQVKQLTEELRKWKQRYEESSDDNDRLKRKLASEKELTEKEHRQAQREKEEKEELSKECEILNRRLKQKDDDLVQARSDSSSRSERNKDLDREQIVNVKSAASEKRIRFLEEEHDVQIAKLRSSIRKLEREIDDRTSRLREIEEENSSLRKRLKIAMRDIEDSLAISTMLEKSLDFDRRSFTSREAMVKEQYVQQRDNANLLATQLAEAQNEIVYLEQKNSWLAEEIERERTSANVLKAQNIKSTSEQITSLRELTYKLRAENEQLHDERITSAKKLSDLKNELNSIRRESANTSSHKQERDLLENQLKDARKEIKALKDHLNVRQRDHTRHDELLTAAEKSLDVTSESLQEEITISSDLQHRNYDLEDELKAAKDKISKLNEKINSLQATNLQLDGKFKRLEQRYESLEEALSTERASALNAVKVIKADSERQISELLSQSNEYKQQAIELRKSLSTLEHKLRNVTESRDRLKDEVSNLDRTVESCRLKAREESEACLASQQKSQQLSLTIEKFQQLQIDQSKELARLQTSLTYNESLLEKEKNKVVELEQELKEAKVTIDHHKNHAEKFEEQAKGLNARITELKTLVDIKQLQVMAPNTSESPYMNRLDNSEDNLEDNVVEDTNQSINTNLDKAFEVHNEISNRASGLERDVARLKLALTSMNKSEVQNYKTNFSSSTKIDKSDGDDSINLLDRNDQLPYPNNKDSSRIGHFNLHNNYKNLIHGEHADSGINFSSNRRLRTRSAQAFDLSGRPNELLYGSHSPTPHYRSYLSEHHSDPNRLRQLLFKKSLLESHPAHSILNKPAVST
ncbi:hypothetical protein TrispH2_006758 [Trichoplax sp. H2]|nr:hypothetical protein TrispH2_006758 [Trichoplax sp. H2]|eukprot:RDD40380.1 hypothetical protein TrispH2_006758 [Trichoplax sp. H2]